MRYCGIGRHLALFELRNFLLLVLEEFSSRISHVSNILFVVLNCAEINFGRFSALILLPFCLRELLASRRGQEG
jgi:hypothetical protein